MQWVMVAGGLVDCHGHQLELYSQSLQPVLADAAAEVDQIPSLLGDFQAASDICNG
jgi:hypothetical protein